MDSYVVTATFIVNAPSAEIARMFVDSDVAAVVEADQTIPVPATDPLFGGVGYRSGVVIDVAPTLCNRTLFLPFPD